MYTRCSLPNTVSYLERLGEQVNHCKNPRIRNDQDVRTYMCVHEYNMNFKRTLIGLCYFNITKIREVISPVWLTLE